MSVGKKVARSIVCIRTLGNTLRTRVVVDASLRKFHEFWGGRLRDLRLASRSIKFVARRFHRFG